MGMLYELDEIERAVVLPFENRTTFTEQGADMLTKSGQEYINSITSVSSVAIASGDNWRYEFRPDEKYPDLGVYTILAPNPDAGKEGVVYSGQEIAMADTDDEEVAVAIVKEHNAHRKLVKALGEMLNCFYPHACDRSPMCAKCSALVAAQGVFREVQQ